MIRFTNLITIILSALFISGCGLGEAEKAHEQDVLNFRQKRINYLKSRQGYLNLVGLYWFFDGEYRLGSGQDNDLVLPSGFLPNFGTLSKSGDKLKFQFVEPVLLDSLDKVSDYAFNTNDIDHTFSWKSFQWFGIKRGGHYAIRLKDFENPDMDPSFEIPYFDIDPKWKIKGKFEAYPEIHVRTISNIFGHPIEQPAIGIISFKIDGKSYQLEAHMEGPKRTIIFKDGTTGDDTYSGGRELYFDAPDMNGNVIIDFNKAFNFPCAYNNFTTCPVPPPFNHLDLRITAGARVHK